MLLMSSGVVMEEVEDLDDDETLEFAGIGRLHSKLSKTQICLSLDKVSWVAFGKWLY